MTTANDSKLDLSFTRIVDFPKEYIWRYWTEPDLLLPWFCPLPWRTIACEIDLRPGGIFSTTMQSPEGAAMAASRGCILEVVPNQRLTWTSALLPGFRPSLSLEKCGESDDGFMFTATIELEDHHGKSGTGTKYTATVQHADAASCARHAAMGFEEGWGKALEQMVAIISSSKA